MTTLLLIRHASNDYVRRGKLAGRLPGVHLDELGRRQAQALAARLGKIKLKAVYASPLERAMETAEPISASQGLAVDAVDGLSEVDVGDWQGRTLKSLRRLKAWQVVQHQPSLARFPNGETFAQAQARSADAVDRLISVHKGKRAVIACVSHADVIKLIVAHYLGLPLDLFQRLAVQPASITTLSIGPSHALLLGFNDVSAAQPG